MDKKIINKIKAEIEEYSKNRETTYSESYVKHLCEVHLIWAEELEKELIENIELLDEWEQPVYNEDGTEVDRIDYVIKKHEVLADLKKAFEGEEK